MVKPMPKPALAAQRQPQQPIVDPDIVDRIFDLLRDHPEMPDLAPTVLSEVKATIRSEFRGERIYIAGNPDAAREQQERAAAVLGLFNGRNASELARTLGIGRATVYRYLKQAGRRPAGAVCFKVEPADRLTFSGRETAPPLPLDDA